MLDSLAPLPKTSLNPESHPSLFRMLQRLFTPIFHTSAACTHNAAASHLMLSHRIFSARSPGLQRLAPCAQRLVPAARALCIATQRSPALDPRQTTPAQRLSPAPRLLSGGGHASSSLRAHDRPEESDDPTVLLAGQYASRAELEAWQTLLSQMTWRHGPRPQ